MHRNRWRWLGAMRQWSAPTVEPQDWEANDEIAPGINLQAEVRAPTATDLQPTLSHNHT